MHYRQQDISDACLGLPLGQALSLCNEENVSLRVVYTGERSEDPSYTARVVAVRGDTLIVSLFKDGDPRRPEE